MLARLSASVAILGLVLAGIAASAGAAWAQAVDAGAPGHDAGPGQADAGDRQQEDQGEIGRF